MPIKSIEKFTYDINDSPMVLKEKEIFNKLKEESFEKINNLEKKVNTDKLLFKYKGKAVLVKILVNLIMFSIL